MKFVEGILVHPKVRWTAFLLMFLDMIMMIAANNSMRKVVVKVFA